MNLEELKKLAVKIAHDADLDAPLVLSVCEHESSFDPWAVRYEPGFYSAYIEKMVGLTQTEKTMRATSFGLMQIMGQVAREKGFDDKYLTGLCDPEKGLIYGCKKLKSCLELEKGSVSAALLRFNGGGDAKYPDLVLQFIDKYRKETL